MTFFKQQLINSQSIYVVKKYLKHLLIVKLFDPISYCNAAQATIEKIGKFNGTLNVTELAIIIRRYSLQIFHLNYNHFQI